MNRSAEIWSRPRSSNNSSSGFENEIQRACLDCLAFGGMGTLDTIAIDLLYGTKLSSRGEFSVDLVLKVRDELPLSRAV